MASDSNQLKAFLKENKPTELDDILDFILQQKRHAIESRNHYENGRIVWCFETGVINVMQRYLKKHAIHPFKLDPRTNKIYTIQSILVKKKNNGFSVSLRLDKPIDSTIAEYLDGKYFKTFNDKIEYCYSENYCE
jgi:hypothetical protein